MRILAILFLIVGVALAGGAVYYAMEVLPQRPVANVAPEGPKTVQVVAARLPLRYGERLDYEAAKEKLQFVEWPETAVPQGAFTTADELFGENRDKTRTVVRAIEPGEPILKNKLTGFGEAVRVATRLGKGMRPFTIPINAVTGTAGLISPGDRVDILYTRSDDGKLSTYVLLENILVIATDQTTDTERNRAHIAKTATVEVSQEDAQKLIVAGQAGTLQLLLRGIDEVDTSDDGTPSFDSTLLPGAPKIEKKVEKAPVVVEEAFKVRVRKGGRLHEEEVDKTGEGDERSGEETKKTE